MAKLLNDRGHGSNTWPPSKGIAASGGVPGMAEHSFNTAVADEVEHLLKGKLSTYSAQGSNKPDVPLNTRTANYNAQYRTDKTAIGMSHHGNAGISTTRGFGVFYWHSSATGKKLAQMVLEEYKREFPDMPIWGTGLFASKVGDWTNFAILRDTAATFVLIEWEFFTNNAARKIMLTDEYRKRCGKVAAKAACRWYGIKFEEAVKPAAPMPVVKPAAKPTEKGVEELNLTQAQRKELAGIFKKAYDRGVFTSREHEKAIVNGTMTMSRLVYLQSVVAGAALNGGKRI